MYQLELDLRPSLTVQYELPLDYTGCDTREKMQVKYLAWRSSVLTSNGSSVIWQTIPNPAIVVADEVIVKKPLKTMWSNIKQWIGL